MFAQTINAERRTLNRQTTLVILRIPRQAFNQSINESTNQLLTLSEYVNKRNSI